MDSAPDMEASPHSPCPTAAQEASECDVLVVGGGPAGSTVAAALARRGWRIILVEPEAGGFRADARAGDGGRHMIRSRYLIDASGRDTLLATAWRLKRKNPRHQSAAIFAHFRGVERRPGEDAGNISIYRFNSPIMRRLFADPRGLFQLDRGMIAMLAGDVFDDRRVRRRLHLFKFIYAMTALFNLRRHLADLRWRRSQARLSFDSGCTARDGA